MFAETINYTRFWWTEEIVNSYSYSYLLNITLSYLLCKHYITALQVVMYALNFWKVLQMT